MERISEILGRPIQFEEFDTSKNWSAHLPREQWCLVIIAEEITKNYFQEIIRKAIDRNVGYIFSAGKQHDLIHTMADDEIEIRYAENLYLPDHVIVTAGTEDFENGIWEGVYITHNEEIEICHIVILDITKSSRVRVIELMRKFESGYLPED